MVYWASGFLLTSLVGYFASAKVTSGLRRLLLMRLKNLPTKMELLD